MNPCVELLRFDDISQICLLAGDKSHYNDDSSIFIRIIDKSILKRLILYEWNIKGLETMFQKVLLVF